MSGDAPRLTRRPLGLVLPPEPFRLELRPPPVVPDHTLTVWLSDATRPAGPATELAWGRFASQQREAFQVTIDPRDADQPLRVDAPALEPGRIDAPALASAARVKIFALLEEVGTGGRTWHVTTPWVRDARALDAARRQLDAPPYVRALAAPALPLAEGARVHVAAPDVRGGDAIGNLALDAARALRLHGYDVRIWARHIGDELLGACGSLDLLGEEVRPGDLLLYQYSIRDPDLDVVLRCPATKVCFYQGITPPHFLADVDAFTEEQCREGLAELPRLAGFDGWIAATGFTAAELRAAIGQDADVRLVPPTLNLGRFDAIDAAPLPLPGSGRFLLYVGRFAPHKGLGLLLDAFAAWAPADPKCDLVLAGVRGGDDVAARRAALPREIASRVHVVERPGDAALKTLYQACTAYVSASEHEGFCVPIAEALGFGKPVFAYETPAVRETLGGAGYTFRTRDPAALVALWRRVLLDPGELERLREGPQRRWHELRRAADGQRLWDALAGAIRRAARPS